ncbi:aconitase X [Oceanicella actignis]|uniref:cis-3-hydroxy-L-proline dehydratase n=1 Tax=Oceanicella actignis TaxID=1189325 RepID=UPI0011E6C8F2|nr:aconitase X [Oceanicella actignis]TYO89086.1 putative aconitase subunit 1 [Oceanicella actignis]
MRGRVVLPGRAEGEVLACDEPLSFWGGVDPAAGRVIDVRHPLAGRELAGRVLALPGTRGSCTGSGVLLDMALGGRAPAALVFRDEEDVATLGALVAAQLFDRPLPVLRLDAEAFARLSRARRAAIGPDAIETDLGAVPLDPPAADLLELSAEDRAMLDGAHGPAAALAMRILRAMAANQGAERLIDVAQAHIDGCIYASPANLTFAERMLELGARVRIPTTMNAISVDHANWRTQGVAPDFGGPAQRLADAYVRMGCRPSFTCAPYLLEDAPRPGQAVGWSESNAVIYANSVLGARTAKHPDFLDLCIALTGRAPLSGPYLERNRLARRVIEVELPDGIDDAFWPLLGWLAGRLSPDRIPLLRGLAAARPGPEALKALCAAFGATSGAPMLHVEGVTPEAHLLDPDADRARIDRAALREGWRALNRGPEQIDLVAVGSPHASAEECRALADLMQGRKARAALIVTLGRGVLETIRAEGVLARLEAAGARVIPDLCWCSIVEPVFPPKARAVMTNSGKYAHYGPGLSGRAVRFGALAACAEAAATGRAPRDLPSWLS